MRPFEHLFLFPYKIKTQTELLKILFFLYQYFLFYLHLEKQNLYLFDNSIYLIKISLMPCRLARWYLTLLFICIILTDEKSCKRPTTFLYPECQHFSVLPLGSFWNINAPRVHSGTSTCWNFASKHFAVLTCPFPGFSRGMSSETTEPYFWHSSFMSSRMSGRN